MLVQRLQDTIDISLIMKSFHSDHLFLKDVFTFLLKPIKFDPGLITGAV